MRTKQPVLEMSVDEVRAWTGLPIEVSKVAMRRCLGCYQNFESEGNYHRICKSCKLRQDNGTDLDSFGEE